MKFNFGDFFAKAQGFLLAAAFVAVLTAIALIIAEGNRIENRPYACFERSQDGNFIRQNDGVCQ